MRPLLPPPGRSDRQRRSDLRDRGLAATTLTWTATILAALFTGVAALALELQPTLTEDETILSTMGRAVFGGSNVFYFVLPFFTASSLVLSANTAFADFPRLSAVVARDGYMPHQLATRGDRLAFSNGIIALAIVAGLLLIAFDARVSSLVPLFAVGLFASFTLSQAGMVAHHLRLREPRWQLGLAINLVGAMATFAVLAVVLVSKSTTGAWAPTIVIPVLAGVASSGRQRSLRCLPVPPSWISIAGGGESAELIEVTPLARQFDELIDGILVAMLIEGLSIGAGFATIMARSAS